MDLQPGARLGPYEIVAFIGKGGMGEVWRARDPRLNRDVAIKTSRAGFGRRFQREAQSIAALNHPNICTLYDVGPDYLVMEFIEGTSLSGPLNLVVALRHALQIVDAICAAHARAAAAASSQNLARNATYEDMPAVELSNDKLQLTVLTTGSSIASVVLADDPNKLNPLWDPIRLSREPGRGTTNFNNMIGHFVCIGGFGNPSADERKVGLLMHGEGYVTKYSVASSREGNTSNLTMNSLLPVVQENFTRTYHMVDGENVIYVDSTLESLLGFDRPIAWAEHMTFSSPFLEARKVTFFLSGDRSQNRDYAAEAAAAGRGGPGASRAGAGSGTGAARGGAPGASGGGGRMQRRLVSGADFTWPMAPGLDGKLIDLSQLPDNPHYLDHSTTLLDTTRKLEWVAALHSTRRLVYGYVFRREDYPWVQHWGNFPSENALVRAFEIGTQPYDLPRRTVYEKGPMFGNPVWRWLPAKSKIDSHLILFFAHVPDGFNKVDDVKLENGRISIEDHTAQKTIVLAASRGIPVE